MPFKLHHSAYDYGAPTGSVWVKPGPRAHYGRLEGSEQCDVVVVGAGLVGLSAAYHLAKTYSAQVVLIDAASPGWGSSGRSSGLCAPAPFSLYKRLIESGGPDSAAAMAKADKEGMAFLESLARTENLPLMPSGTGVLAACAPGILPSGWEHVHDADPVFDFTPVSHDDPFCQGVRIPRGADPFYVTSGVGLDPLSLTRHLADSAVRAGVRLYSGTRARQVIETPHWATISHAGGSIAAAYVILATGGLCRPQGLFDRQILPVPCHALATEPLTDAECEALQIKHPVLFRYEASAEIGPMVLRILPDRRVILAAPVAAQIDPARSADIKLQLRARFLDFFPELNNTRIARSWYLVGAQTSNGLPFVGPLSDKKRVLYAGGMDFDSITLGLWLGMAAAKVVAQSPQEGPRPFVSTTPLQKTRFAGWRRAKMARRLRDLNRQVF